ncbi:MAG: hypothetical protein GX637_01645 [Clostridiales bacterium]|nr:hypothetical protein [Clostridiales bacterium]
MKRFLSLLLSICLILSCVGAVAEEVSQAALAEAFKAKVNEFLNNIAPGNSLVMSVEPAGEAPFTQTISLLSDGEEKQIVDWALQIPGQEAPVQLQVSQEAVWLAAQGQVYELQLSDIEGILQAVVGSFGAPQVDSQIMSELTQLLMVNVIVPAVQVENEENTVTVHVALTAQYALQGVARFVDQVLATERYWEALQPLFQFVAQRQNYQGDLAAEFQQNWPQIKEQLLATETDLALNADLVIRTDPESGNTTVTGKAALSESGQTVLLTLDAENSKAAFAMQCVLSLAMGEMEQTAAALNAHCDKLSGAFAAELSLPAMQAKASLSGAYAAGGLQCRLTVFERNALTAAVDVETVSAGETISLHGAGTVNGKTASCSLFWSKRAKALSIQSSGLVLTLDIQQDQAGKLTLARLIQSPGAKGASGWTVTYVPGLLTYQDPQNTVEITPSFISETEHVVDIAMLTQGQSEAAHAYLRTRLTEAGDGWRIESTAEMEGQTVLTAYITSQQREGEITLLSSQETIRLTPEMVQMMLAQLMAAAQQQAVPAPETGE